MDLNQQATIAEIDEQKIIVQDKTKFLQTIFKTPKPITQPVSKEWLEKQIEILDKLKLEDSAKQKAYNDSQAEKRNRFVELLKEF